MAGYLTYDDGTTGGSGIGDCTWYCSTADNASGKTTSCVTKYDTWLHVEQQWQAQTITGYTNSTTSEYRLTVTEDTTWHTWVLDGYGQDACQTFTIPAAQTPEQITEQEARRVLDDTVWKAKEEARKVAEVKGEQLLNDIIGDEDFKKYKNKKYIDVPSSEAGKVYRVRPERRIGIVKNGVEQPLSLCIHSRDWGFVLGDLIATHILLCKFDEQHMLKTANLHKMAA